MARPQLKIDPLEVERLAEIQASNREIAYVLGCSEDTLQRRFKYAIEAGRSKGKLSLRRKQYEVAMAGDTKLLVFLGKQYLGQSDKVENIDECDGFEFVGADGKPV